ncbi:MAG: MerR family transcriptional regulator [Bacillota bacterium]|nr:helix-turn-helix domain-containing protein [Clostridia bacterium]
MDESRLINTKDACRLLGVSAKTLRRWCNDGFLSYYTTVGGHKRFSLKTLHEFLEKNYVKSDE